LRRCSSPDQLAAPGNTNNIFKRGPADQPDHGPPTGDLCREQEL
jgi:hypothetical protein